MMAKPKSIFACQSCGATFMRWSGRCTECGEWNTIVEEVAAESGSHARPSIVEEAVPIPVTDASQSMPERMTTRIPECDRVLGGGIVPGSLLLFGGDPGIGKSTLML
ncbi:MAG: DNA repair protein RadA, partial [Lentisphaerae bacterium]|nr:DNA repair protein RadA [Lentisphaerota bacterium]